MSCKAPMSTIPFGDGTSQGILLLLVLNFSYSFAPICSYLLSLRAGISRPNTATKILISSTNTFINQEHSTNSASSYRNRAEQPLNQQSSLPTTNAISEYVTEQSLVLPFENLTPVLSKGIKPSTKR